MYDEAFKCWRKALDINDYGMDAWFSMGFTVKAIPLFHIPQGIFVLILHENPGLACAKLHVPRSLCASY